MFALKTLLVAAAAATTLASPLLPRQCADTCGSTCYAQSDIDAAVQQGCSDLQSGSAPHSYPHQYNDYEGFSFPDPAPYYEFPILSNGNLYTGGSPGADRVIITSSCAYEGVITHQGASGNAFLQCTAS